MNDSVLALPFDQYQRYRLVSDLLRQLRGSGAPLRVLDVGGRTAVLRDFLPDARIELVDMEANAVSGLVLGDGSRLPFKDAAFDAVCAFDTLEHVPPARREAFVAECRRVARSWVILAGPYAAPRVEEAEQVLQNFLERKLGQRHRYLDEHLHHGLPLRAAVESQLQALGARTTSIGHGNLDRWLVLQCLSMYLDYDPALRELGRDFQRFYNASLYASDHAEPVYRHVVVAALGSAALPASAQLLDAPIAPAGVLRTAFDLAGELVHFDRERQHWSEERAEFQRVVESLGHDLEGHRAALRNVQTDRDNLAAALSSQERDLRSEIAGLERVIVDLRHDLGSHQTALSAARGQGDEFRRLHSHTEAEYRVLESEVLALRQAHADLASDLEGHRALVRDLERDLAGHRQVVNELRRSLEGSQAVEVELRRELETRRATEGELRSELQARVSDLSATLADLEGHRLTLASLQGDLDGHRRALADTRADLEGHRAEMAGLRAELNEERARRAHLEGSLSQSDSELRRTLAFANGLEQSLAQREVVYEQLRAELRSRRRNLVRVFRPPH